MYLIGLLLLTQAAIAACPSTFPQVLGELEGALSAYDRGLYQEFRAQHAALSEDLPCLQAMLEPAEVRAVFLVNLLESWGRKDRDATALGLHALLDLEPDFAIGTEVKLSDIPLQEFLEQAQATHAPPETAPLPLVPWSTWQINGRSAPRTIPVGRPVVAQLLDTREGKVLTWYLPQGGLPPGFETESDVSSFDWGNVELTRLLPPEQVRRVFKSERFLGAGAGVVGAAAVAGLGVGTWMYRQYGQCRDGELDSACQGQVDDWIAWNGRLVKGGYVAGGAAAAPRRASAPRA